MDDRATEQELKDRFGLVERMIAEGRHDTASWGWVFVLWGIVYYVAIAWSTWDRSAWAWPVTVVAGITVTAVDVASKARKRHAGTTLGRSIASIWIALGISMFVLFLALSLSGRLTDLHVFMAVSSALLGIANGASGLILRWKVQLACAFVWWLAAIGTCFGDDKQSMIVFLVAIFVCQILFGIYVMIAEGQKSKQRHLRVA